MSQIMNMETLTKIVGGTPHPDNSRSFLLGLNEYGRKFGLEKPHRLAQYVAQLAHESAGFRYDRELWGPTPAQKRYDTRTDLGNTPERDGDGFKYRGRGPIQITGGSNYRQFTKWARNLDVTAPDFYADPDAVLTDPWEGLGPIWYWSTRGLNVYADNGDNEMITRRINGGLNGYQDRLRYYDRAALILLGRDPEDLRKFQLDHGLMVDGVSGPRTRAAMHKALRALKPAPAKTGAVSNPFADFITALADFLKGLFK